MPCKMQPYVQLHGEDDVGTLNLVGNEKVIQLITFEQLGRKLLNNSFLTFKRRGSRPTLSSACVSVQEL